MRTTDRTLESPTLIEGLPGLGLVASIAVDRIREQLALEEYGTIVSDDLPPVASFEAGRVRDPVRVYAGEEPPVMTLASDVPIPPDAYESLGRCVLHDLAEEIDRAVFLVGAPAESEGEVGDVVGVATTDDLEAALGDAGIAVAEGPGAIGGVTGSLLADCYHGDVPAAALIVRSHPRMPDPGAARAVIEDALEPLVEFDIDTDDLLEQAEQIREQKRQMAEQLREYQRGDQRPSMPGMYQ